MVTSNRAEQLFATDPGPLILPSLLQCDFSRLRDVMHAAEAAGVRMFHLDVMDGHFVPNLTYGPPIIRSMRKATNLPFDAHLMISNPEQYLDEFFAAGCDIITIHIEAVSEPRRVLERIRALGALAGVALNPPTPVDLIAPLFDLVNVVIPMSVMAGFGGQEFQIQVLEKFRWLRKHGPPTLHLEADGGINRDTIRQAADAGADLFVVGSALFMAPDFKTEFESLQSLIH